MPPEKYFRKIPADEIKRIFSAALIPLFAESGEMTYSEFLKARAQTLSFAAIDLLKYGSPTNGTGSGLP